MTTHPRSTRDAHRWAVLRHTPHDIDPLTWLAGNRLPLAFAVLVPTLAGFSLAGSTETPAELIAQLIAVAIMASACIIVHWFARPLRSPFTVAKTAIPVAMASIATVLSAANPPGENTVIALSDLESWWAPLGFAFVIGALVPYTSVSSSATIGTIAAILTGVTAFLAFPDSDWPTVSTVAIALVPIIIATAGAVVFQWQVATRIARWSNRATPAIVTGRLLRERARLAVVRAELATVSARVTGLLTDIADRAHVTDHDQKHAAELAAIIRTELVERSNETWLQTVARGRPVTIIDPEHLADTMSDEQRSTVHSLILTVLDSPEVQYPHVLIELRREPDNATAVAITIDAGLAEGRRIMLLAPHYLTLRNTVDELQWKGGDTIRMRFRATPGTR